jgi:hypothetical protein
VNKIIIILLAILLAGDFVFSFIQYYNTPLFGDIPVSVLTNEHVQQLYDDPFGFQVIQTGEKQFNPNRYFSHLFLKAYFRNVPIFLQNFVSPVSSVYLASAMIKITIQLIFIFVLAVFISGDKLFGRKFLISAVILAPLFQVFGYWSRMGIVDKSVAYSFFYALPLVLLMLYFLPVFNRIQNKLKLNPVHYFLLVPLIIVLPFTGPLNPPVIILVSSFIFLDYLLCSKEKSLLNVVKTIPFSIYILLVPISLLSLYSLYLGMYDSSHASVAIPLVNRFYRLPEGLVSQLFHSPGFPLMLLIIGMNIFIIRKNNYPGREKLMKAAIWIGIFTLLYILLLPFGGYTPYRPRIIRYDTFMPVNIALYYLFGVSTFSVFNQIKGKNRMIYRSGIIIYLLILMLVDTGGTAENDCESNAFEKMAGSKESVVAIPKDCFVLDWQNVFDYQLNRDKAELIYYWGITDEIKLFYNEQKQ